MIRVILKSCVAKKSEKTTLTVIAKFQIKNNLPIHRGFHVVKCIYTPVKQGRYESLWKQINLLLLQRSGIALGSVYHYVGEISKRNFISTVRPTVHTNPSRKQTILKTFFKPGEV